MIGQLQLDTPPRHTGIRSRNGEFSPARLGAHDCRLQGGDRNAHSRRPADSEADYLRPDIQDRGKAAEGTRKDRGFENIFRLRHVFLDPTNLLLFVPIQIFLQRLILV